MGYLFTFTAFAENSRIPIQRYQYNGSWSIATIETLFDEIRINAEKLNYEIACSLLFYTYTIETKEVNTLFHIFTEIRNGLETTWSDEYMKNKFEHLYEVIKAAYSIGGYIQVKVD